MILFEQLTTLLIANAEKSIQWINSNFSTITNFAVALSSLVVSCLAYKRDNGRFIVSVDIGEIFQPAPHVKIADALIIRVINTGRRPMILRSISSEHRWNKIKRIINYFLSLFLAKKHHYNYKWLQLNYPQVMNAVFNNNKSRVVNEGEVVDVVIDFPAGLEIAKKIISHYPRFYASDSLDTQYYISRKNFKSLKESISNIQI
jgi:hypothetical protein